MTALSHGHLTDEELREVIDGQLSARVRDHLASCPVCRTLHRRAWGVLGALRFAPEPVLSRSLRDRLMARYDRTHRPHPPVMRLLTLRIPLYQVAAAAALLLLWQAASHHPTRRQSGVLPPLTAAVSDLWAGSPSHAFEDGGATDGLSSVGDMQWEPIPFRPCLEPNLLIDE
ncbi:MAG: hypothetical protein JXC32_22135 [Anaerolineae bacterium]|nr:hypothetical protein [Anaerolineae bacterium]